jgi:hypothetical protein
MEFPRLVFKSPGPYYCNGGTYGHVPVENMTEYSAALAAGYSPTVPDALAAAKRPKMAEEKKEPDEPSESKQEETSRRPRRPRKA